MNLPKSSLATRVGSYRTPAHFLVNLRCATIPARFLGDNRPFPSKPPAHFLGANRPFPRDFASYHIDLSAIISALKLKFKKLNFSAVHNTSPTTPTSTALLGQAPPGSFAPHNECAYGA